MAENTEALCQAIGEYLANQLGIRTEYVSGIPWQEREQLFDAGKIHILWLCGLPYVHRAELPECSLELLAAPVPTGERYDSSPIYFSDVIVRRDSVFNSLRHLRGARWAYNEPRSHSGFNVVRARLAALGETSGFFGRVIEAGSHSKAVQLVSVGEVDGAAIDSTVLQWIGDQEPALRDEIRVVDVLGPSPIPPWVVSASIDASVRQELRRIFLTMHNNSTGRDILALGGLNRFGPAANQDYDPIRVMARAAATVSLI